MNIKIETWGQYKYDRIKEEYGSILHKFGLTKVDESAYITVNSLKDLFELDRQLTRFDEEREDWGVYFGLVDTHDKGEPMLEIKDNYD
jgi:hypothetical protein